MSTDPDLKPVINESGIEVKTLYTPEDVEASGGVEMVGNPGEYPFTRGIHPEMYRKRPWTMRQYTGFANAKKTNERFKYLIANGQTGLNVAFDLPTQIGLDTDDPMAVGEVGRVGMAVDTLKDFEIAFDGIDLEKITVSLTINGAAAILIAMYLAMAEKRGYDISKLRGTAQNDILKEFIGRGTWIFPVEPSVKLVCDTIEYCATHAPKYTPVSVCGYHIRESGADPAEEMAYAFCIAKAYTDGALERGLDIDEFAGRLSFNFNIYGNIFEQEVALTHNDSGVFRDDWVYLKANADSPCIFTKGIDLIKLPIRHGEGKLVANEDLLAELESKNLTALRYANADGSIAEDFPANPNGALNAIAGICDESGRIFGLMPHPEAFLSPFNSPTWTKEKLKGELASEGEGVIFFRNAVDFVASQS